MSFLNCPYFHDEVAAIAKLESVLWAGEPVCPHCGGVGKAYEIKGARTRAGLRKCGHCKKQFTVKVGTVFESSHIPLHKWLQATYLMCSSKKGISSHQLHRTLEITYKSAWFMSHRLREAMNIAPEAPAGGEGGMVEIDETYIGQKEGVPKRRAHHHKHAILTLVERHGKARSFHVDGTSFKDLLPILQATIAPGTKVMTDEASQYRKLKKHFPDHETVNHGADEYVRGEAHTNTVEDFYSVFKRGMKGIYQHCSDRHLQRYVTEFDFRYNNRVALGVDDESRFTNALKGIIGKRLTYKQPCQTHDDK
jgi:transposase-like protein